jgi:hypothetical protein
MVIMKNIREKTNFSLLESVLSPQEIYEKYFFGFLSWHQTPFLSPKIFSKIWGLHLVPGTT